MDLHGNIIPTIPLLYLGDHPAGLPLRQREEQRHQELLEQEQQRRDMESQAMESETGDVGGFYALVETRRLPYDQLLNYELSI